MARDNGSRGSYRHSNATEPRSQEQQPSASEKAIKHSSDKDSNSEAMKTFKCLEYIDSPNPEHLDDYASDLLSLRFPPMSVPGSISRRQTDFFRSSGQQPPAYGWKDVTIATVFYGSAAFGFGVIMWDGLKATGGLLVDAGTHLLYEGLMRLGF
ncbi:hypothetical protein VMCG_10734 [Cytospora schulzeri]|uniref:Uncharacterized protein n=1 Tax=Cytospora schulzeri TaxID=448051 RepID=A0A423V8H9_9PEZI|nr:hypothetical protein VMCG_10734 [Valsa malicola]